MLDEKRSKEETDKRKKIKLRQGNSALLPEELHDDIDQCTHTDVHGSVHDQCTYVYTSTHDHSAHMHTRIHDQLEQSAHTHTYMCCHIYNNILHN